jgi:hypothetical protein
VHEKQAGIKEILLIVGCNKYYPNEYLWLSGLANKRNI